MSGHDLSRSRAVLVGTWDYTELPPVPAVEHSFRRMADLLTSDLCGWPAERVTQLTNLRQPGDLPRRLISLFDDAEDVALFYFVGHGQSDDRGRLCLGLAETSSEARFRASTSLEFEDVRTALRYSNARTKIVILDCCFAGLATQPEAVLSGVSVADRAACEGAYTMAASAEYDVARYEQRTDRERPPETYFTKCLCDTVRDGIPGQGPTLSVDAIYRQMVTAMRARQLVHPTQANRGTASTFPFAHNVAALREPATPEPGEHRVPGPRPSRMATLRRSRLVVVLLVALVAAATTLIVLRADDTPADDTLADTTREDIDNLVTPPPVTEAPPNDTGAPDRSYEQHTACVETLSSTPTATASWGQERFDFPKLHALATGQGQTVAVIDTGVNPHPLFQERLHQGNDYVSSEEPQDCDGHGTAIAGLIAADTGTARDDDFQGMAPKATILAIRQSSETFGYRDGNGSDIGSVGTLETLAQAIMGAADANVDVIAITVHSCRLADAGPINDAEQSVQAALRYAVDDADVVVVAAAGDVPGCQGKNNDDPNRPSVIPTPAWFSDHVLSVAALTRGGRLTNFSVRGPWVGVAAPGTEITTLDPNLDGLISLSETDIAYDTRTSRSTSYAAAYVAGLAALVRDYRPDLDARQVMNRIKYTAEHPQGGRNDQVGYGMIRPVEALTATVPDE